MSDQTVPAEQPQRRVGIENPILRDLVNGYADVENTAIRMQEAHAAQLQEMEQRYRDIVNKGAEHTSRLEQEVAELKEQIAAHRCPDAAIEPLPLPRPKRAETA